jgi:hypothetical protein
MPADVHLSRWGDLLSIEEAHLLVGDAGARGIPVVYVGIPAARAAFGYYDEHLGVPPRAFIKIDQDGREPEYYVCHPPPRLLLELAMTIATELARRGYLPDTVGIDRVPSAASSESTPPS